MSAIEFSPNAVSLDGWLSAGEVLTYASATTFTVAGDRTAKYQKGTRLKLTQTTTKYFVCVGVSFAAGVTTVTVTGGSDYSLANAVISDPYYSYAVSPQGYPDWFAYTPTFTGFSSSPTAGYARFKVVGRMCFYGIHYNDGTSNATTFAVTLPINSGVTGGAYQVVGPVKNNGTQASTPGLVGDLTAGSTTLNVYRDLVGAAWTNSGAKNAQIEGWYEI